MEEFSGIKLNAEVGRFVKKHWTAINIAWQIELFFVNFSNSCRLDIYLRFEYNSRYHQKLELLKIIKVRYMDELLEHAGASSKGFMRSHSQNEF